ncbi:zinc-dependent dehydrogenase [bacterium]|nr:zinc-dependent dehydrogenase [bacterium]MBU1752698.1 zinc-dependent dehydrogenase [bacterium]
MRVAMYYSNQDVRIQEMFVPEISSGEILLKVEASGICGSDVMEWYRIHRVPLVLGHEVAGTIVQTGDDVKQYKVGDRISVSHHVPCNACHYCMRGHQTVCNMLRQTNFDPGGFAEFVRLPAINVDRGVYPLPDHVSFEEATFIEPVACVLRGQRLAGIQPGQRVLVLGSGIAGLLHIHLARISGASQIIATDVSDYRLEAARRFGADVAMSAKDDIPARVREINDGYLADLVIVCTGAPSAILQALHSVERCGTVLFFAPTDKGITIPLSINELFWRNEIALVSSYAGDFRDHMTALELISTGRIQVREMITHRLKLSETGYGFQLVTKAQDSIKVIIEPQR